MIEYYFTTLLLFAVICALLRQMNKERLEREDGALRYRELALRVRNVQLREEAVQESTQDWFDQHSQVPVHFPLTFATSIILFLNKF